MNRQELELSIINKEDIPKIISSNIDNLLKYEAKIEKSDEKAKDAMKYISEEMKKYKNESILGIKYKSGNTKEIIEDTQKGIERLLECVKVNTEAQEVAFKYCKQLAETTTYLFKLGCTNIAINRITVRAIEKKLEGASKEEISELAREELLKVARQLKQQEDLLKKEEANSKILKEHEEKLAKSMIDVLKLNKEILKQQMNSSELSKKIDEHGILFKEKDKLDAEQTKKLDDHENLFKEKNIKDYNQDKNIDINKKNIQILKSDLLEKDKLDAEQTKKIDDLLIKIEKIRKISMISLTIAIIAIIVSVIGIFVLFNNIV